MSYVFYGSCTELEGFGDFGALERYRGLSPSPNEVYVLRLRIRGAIFSATPDVMELVRAVGKAFIDTGWLKRDMDYDIRGVAMSMPEEGSDLVQADIICTRTQPSAFMYPLPFRDADDMIEVLSKDERLKAHFPEMKIESAEWLWLAGDELKDETQHWLHQPMLWDHKVEPHETAAFERAEGVWIGTADKPLYAISPPVPPSLVSPPAQQVQPATQRAAAASTAQPPAGGRKEPETKQGSPPPPAKAGVGETDWLLWGAVAVAAVVAYKQISRSKAPR